MATDSPSFGTIPQNAPGKPEPFTLRVSDEDLADFRSLLRLSKVGPATWENGRGDGSLGVTRDWLAGAKDAWLGAFDWRAHEAHINSFPNFKLAVQDAECGGELDVHFAALFSARPDATPVIFMHGWPGSFLEFLPILDLLRQRYTPETLPFHAVVPSLPGYTLSSGPPVDRDFTLRDAARVLNQLMVDLGFGGGYVAQGGDVGYFLARIMSATYDECKALHGESGRGCGNWIVFIVLTWKWQLTFCSPVLGTCRRHTRVCPSRMFVILNGQSIGELPAAHIPWNMAPALRPSAWSCLRAHLLCWLGNKPPGVV